MNKTNKNTGIDALFGSKTRVKLLHLFLNNPEKSFYVREITRLIDEQINSVRRELANMVKIGVVTSDNAENKLYYQINEQYEHYVAFRAIFAADFDVKPAHVATKKQTKGDQGLIDIIKTCKPVRIALMAGMLVPGSASRIDLVVVGAISPRVQKVLIEKLEASVGRELVYTFMGYDEFYYRLSVRDKFISDIVNTKHVVAVDTDNILKTQKG